MADIHPTAVVAEQASLGQGVVVGPLSVIGPEVSLADGVVVHSHVAIAGRTTIGSETQIFPFASIGHRPQDLKYAGEESELVIGAKNMIRELVTMNPGTEGGGMVTRVGDSGLFMMGVHIAHDCQVGDRVVMANNATLAGHVVVEDDAIIGGLAAVHQFVRIGRRAMIGGLSGVEHDVLPYGLVMGERAWLEGVNLVGLKRSGHSRQAIHDLKSLYDALFADRGTLAERLDVAADQFPTDGPTGDVLAFLQGEGQRALCKPKHVAGT